MQLRVLVALCIAGGFLIAGASAAGRRLLLLPGLLALCAAAALYLQSERQRSSPTISVAHVNQMRADLDFLMSSPRSRR